MLKRLAIAVLFVVILPIYGQDKGSQSGGNQNDGVGSQSPAIGQFGTATCVIKQETSTIECQWPRNVPESKFSRLFSPENAPNIGLFFVGLAGVIAAVVTLFAITKQAKLMEGQLEEMRKAREIDTRTLLLQYRPKIIVRNAKILSSSFVYGQPWEFEIQFQIVNIGGTAAHVSVGSYVQIVSAIGHDVGRIELKWGDVCHLEKATLEPGQSIKIVDSALTGVALNIDWENFNQGAKVSPRHIVYFTGTIYYTDDLQIPRSTGLHRSLEPKSREFIANRETEQEYSD